MALGSLPFPGIELRTSSLPSPTGLGDHLPSPLEPFEPCSLQLFQKDFSSDFVPASLSSSPNPLVTVMQVVPALGWFGRALVFLSLKRACRCLSCLLCRVVGICSAGRWRQTRMSLSQSLCFQKAVLTSLACTLKSSPNDP